ncbi:MAG: hypothetical protein QW331_01605 [Candidatus Woesearchaeota archaeon]
MVYAFGIEVPLIEILFALGVIGAIVLLEIIIVLAISAYQMKNIRELVEELLRKAPLTERTHEIRKELEQHLGKNDTRFHEMFSLLGAKFSNFFYNLYIKIKHLFHFHTIKNFLRRKKKEDKIKFNFNKK